MAAGDLLKFCRICETYQDNSSFSNYKLQNGNLSRRKVCRSCRSLQFNKNKKLKTDQLKGRVNKLKAVKLFGNICSLCGLSFHPVCYDFHHEDETTKKNNPSYFLKGNWDKAKKELEKCKMVCKNCHALVHFKYNIGEGD